MVILLMVIGDYFINGYYDYNINGYWWLFVSRTNTTLCGSLNF
jgi:hypothetical protein